MMRAKVLLIGSVLDMLTLIVHYLRELQLL